MISLVRIKRGSCTKIERENFLDELLISLVLAFTDQMPSKPYPEAIAIEISQLESVGESIMEHVYVDYAEKSSQLESPFQ